MELRSLRYFLTVADEGHVGRAAERLHMTQPPLSRAIRQLEDEIRVSLFDRTPRGVTLTLAGSALAVEARTLLEHVDRVPSRVRAAAGAATLAVGTLADTAEHLGARLVSSFRETDPAVRVSIVEADLSDPSAGLRAGLVDVAVTRTPFDTAGLALHALSSERVGVVLRLGDPLAERASVRIAELANRRWIRLPPTTDERWRQYWTLPGSNRDATEPAMRTIQECLQAVLWNGTTALAPLGQSLPDGLVAVPVEDRSAHRLVIAWRRDRDTPVIRSFVRTAGRLTNLRTP